MTRFSLSSFSWEFGQVPRLPFDAPHADDRAAVREWLPATVPGNVRLDLHAAGRLPAPHRDSAWVDDADWWYRVSFPVDGEPGQRVFVRFAGLDYRAAIFAGKMELARHKGMFSRVTVDVTDHIHDGVCHLAVRLWGSGALPRRKLSRAQKIWQAVAQRLQNSWTGVYPNRSATLKMQMSFGWDFAPRVLTTGIWDEVSCAITGHSFLEDVGLAVTPEGNGTLRLAVNTIHPNELPAILTIFGDDAPHTFRFTIPPNTPHSEHHFTLPAPKLWQPWDRGTPFLYRARVEIPGSDAVETRFGVRSVTLDDWQFRINGVPEFARGFNWVPVDIFPGRIAPADYRTLLAMAKDTGANFLRVWGGGLREKQSFYDICDELGLLVWQEFPFACLFLGSAPQTDEFLTLLRQEAGEIVRQLDFHPSVVAFCGGNEFSPRRNRAIIRTLKNAIAENSLSLRPFLPASPSVGDAHNWHVWHGKAPLAAFRRERARFLSEFGLQSLPHTNISPQQWEDWHGDPAKLWHYLRPFLGNDDAGEPASDALIAASQQAQATGLQIAIEHMRRRKHRTGGVLVWQLNEPLPAISWAVVDYFRRPKAAFEMLKTIFAPVLASVDFTPGKRWHTSEIFFGTAWVVNDTPHTVSGLCSVALDGAEIFSAPAEIPPYAARSIGSFSQRLEAIPTEMTVTLTHGEKILSRNQYDLRRLDTPPALWGLRLRRWLAEWVLR